MRSKDRNNQDSNDDKSLRELLNMEVSREHDQLATTILEKESLLMLNLRETKEKQYACKVFKYLP